MKARLIIKDDRGRTFSGEVVLTADAQSQPTKAPRNTQLAREKLPSQLDFDLPDRAFIKRYVKGLSGPKKFVLLLAFMTRGATGKDVQLSELERRWNRMTSSALLGYRFNRFYPITAREHGWVNVKKKGVYTLRSTWKGIFSSGD